MQIRMCQAYLIDLVAVFNAIFVQSNMLENIMFFWENFREKKIRIFFFGWGGGGGGDGGRKFS